MAKTSDVRGRMIDAGLELLSRRGYGVTLLDVVKQSKTPRGSIYYHFPNGKEELAIEVARKLGRDMEMLIESKARKTDGPVEFLEALIDHHATRLVRSEFSEGCPLMAITTSSDSDSAELAEAVADGFAAWIGAIAGALRGMGVDGQVSEQLANTVVAGIEGAVVLARAKRSREPLTHFRSAIPALLSGATATV